MVYTPCPPRMLRTSLEHLYQVLVEAKTVLGQTLPPNHCYPVTSSFNQSHIISGIVSAKPQPYKTWLDIFLFLPYHLCTLQSGCRKRCPGLDHWIQIDRQNFWIARRLCNLPLVHVKISKPLLQGWQMYKRRQNKSAPRESPPTMFSWIIELGEGNT